MKFVKLSVSALALTVLAAGAAAARDQVRLVGSSTVFPYSQAAAENFANATGSPAPVVESTGTGGGMKIFCEGIGEAHADMTGASRAMKKSEYELCAKNGVTDITEVLIGYDGLSIAVSRATPFQWNLTEEQIYLAFAAQVPVNGEWKDNPYKKWSEIDASLPDVEILACSRMRQDGPFVEAGENDNLIVQRLEADPNAVGIFGYSFLFENLDKLQGIPIDGVEPNPETIASFEYGVARPIFVYIKNAHRGVIPGFNEFIAEYVSDTALADGGYQQERGLTVLSAEKLVEVQKAALDAAPMAAPEK
ncbi:MAG: phosphate ABC transporter substrate-binding protein [Alphaproteobacteria bacterium HGW-Alphaproteobacteria-2]|nr:MAG: phosphate ABC transporter substrate-binding protein [Alphaproteobacteria bacterium HGW-Alphaproteobacteria-2]